MKCNSLVLFKSILQKRGPVTLIGSMKINCPNNPHGQREHPKVRALRAGNLNGVCRKGGQR